MIEPVLVLPMVYVLLLEDGFYYVGTTMNINMRYAQHSSGAGSKWTRLHKPTSIVEVCLGGDAVEREKTLSYMRTFGYANVRGSSWCKIELRTDPSAKET